MCQLTVFTARNEVGARLCFYTCLWFGSQGDLGLCPRGVHLVGGSLSGGCLCHGDPPYGNERAVRILLECILVLALSLHSCSVWNNSLCLNSLRFHWCKCVKVNDFAKIFPLPNELDGSLTVFSGLSHKESIYPLPHWRKTAKWSFSVIRLSIYPPPQVKWSNFTQICHLPVRRLCTTQIFYAKDQLAVHINYKRAHVSRTYLVPLRRWYDSHMTTLRWRRTLIWSLKTRLTEAQHLESSSIPTDELLSVFVNLLKMSFHRAVSLYVQFSTW